MCIRDRELPAPDMNIPTIKTVETSTNLHDERITLTWDPEPNVTSYEVTYEQLDAVSYTHLIGNLGDMTPRGIEVLKSVDMIAAEDTRHTKKLCHVYEIETPLTSYHEHNKGTKGDYIIELLSEGKNVALVSCLLYTSSVNFREVR